MNFFARMRLHFLTALIVCLVSFQALAQQTAKITSSGTGYLEYLPPDYNKNSNIYPLVLFLHGIGERGTTSTDPATIKSSLDKLTNAGMPRYIKNGEKYPFIVISPQLKSSYGTWPANYVMEVLNHVRKELRVDPNRIYITGLSLGGFGTWTTLGANPGVFAAALPICSGGNAIGKACTIASTNIPIWAFHGTADNVVSHTVTTNMINAINACKPAPNPLAKTTLFSGMGHNVWDKVYRETDALNWLTSFRLNGGGSSTPSNQAPTVNAGSDKTITLPTKEATIQASASDPDGSIASWKWTKISGGSASMSGETTSKVRVYNLSEGIYTFRVTVTDNKGASASDDVTVTVKSGTNQAPVANAGPDKTTSSSTIVLTGSGSDKDGKIVSYKWTQYGGASTTMTNANTPTVTIQGLRDGNYFFRLTVTDDKGATAFDNMMVVVKGNTGGNTGTTPPKGDPNDSVIPDPGTNIAPVANAGPDVRTSSSTVVLRGSGSDKDGSIVSYRWTQYGGAATQMTNANTPNVTISGLRTGKYYFRLTVTDDKGKTGYDNVLVVISDSYSDMVPQLPHQANIPPKADADPDKRLASAVAALKLYGSGHDEDGTIVSYKWSQYGGKPLTLSGANQPVVTVSGLEAGKYYLRLTVEDNDGAADHDNMLIVVSEG